MNVITDIASQGLTQALAEQARSLTFADLPDDVRALARQCVLDYVACTLAGSKEDLTGILLAEMEEAGGAPLATVIGHGTRLPVLSAALVNGAASHALDFDDVNLSMTGHPSVVLLSALLALAEERGSSGRDVMTAFVAGYELQCRLGLLLAPGHYNVLGFHATGTLGSFGAAAACAHLLQLDAGQFATALGIAGTQAAGLKSMFGTMCKPLHAGKAAYHGLLAARLARRGFTSRPDVVECPQGFARTHSPDFHPAAALGEPPGGFHIRNNLFKYHAACYMTHAPIEAARRLREQHGLTPGDIAQIRLRLDETCDRVCNIPAPRTGLEAKFSLRLTTAMALAGVDTGGLGSYSEATAADPTLIALRDKVEFDFHNGRPNTIADLELVLTDGRSVSTSYDLGIPASDIQEQGRRLAEKFTSLAEPILGGAPSRDLIGEIGRFEALVDLRTMMRTLRRLIERNLSGLQSVLLVVSLTPGGELMASVEDPSDTRGRLIAADQVEGTSIYNRKGESLGSVEDVMIDKVSGRIAYAVAGFGGFLGIGNRHYPLPWDKLKYDTAMGGYVVDLDRQVLEGAPSYSDADAASWQDPAWGRRVYDYYGMEPYIGMP